MRPDDADRPGRFDPRDPDAPWTHGRADAGAIELHYAVAGPEQGDLVVLLHGFPEYWYTWRHQLPPLAEAGYRVLAPDLRGYNRSEAPEGVDAYRLEPLAADVAGLIDALGRESAFVAGHDWGGIVAWALAARQPAVVDRLGILNAPHPEAFAREIRENPDQRERSGYIADFQAAGRPERGMTRDGCRRVAEVHADAAEGAYTQRESEHFRAAFCEGTDPTAAINYYRAAFTLDEAGRLEATMDAGSVAVPTLVLWGEQDPALSTALLDGLEALVDDRLRVERFPAASHWLPADEPGPVADHLREWFEADA